MRAVESAYGNLQFATDKKCLSMRRDLIILKALLRSLLFLYSAVEEEPTEYCWSEAILQMMPEEEKTDFAGRRKKIKLHLENVESQKVLCSYIEEAKMEINFYELSRR